MLESNCWPAHRFQGPFYTVGNHFIQCSICMRSYENVFVILVVHLLAECSLLHRLAPMLVLCLCYADFTVSCSAPCHSGPGIWLMIHLATSAIYPSYRYQIH